MQLNLDFGGKQVPYLSNWVGAWAMEEKNFHALRTQLESSNLNLHLSTVDQNRQEALDRIEDSFATTEEGIGVINIEGALMKHASSFSSSSSTVAIRKQLRAMAADPRVSGILLKIDSPGGTVSGTKELADEIVKARESKPVWAFCNDLTASAAYWIASQCDRIEANPTSLVGSIGTYCVVVDSSKAAEKAGFEVHVVRAGAFKGMGTSGTEITDDQLAELDKQVVGLNQFFLQAVESGRSLSREQVASLADGRCHLAQQAKTLDLIDDVSSFEDFFDRFVSSVSTPGSPVVSHSEDIDMSAETAKPVPATIAQLEQRFPEALDSWKLSCLKAGYTMEQAVENYNQVLIAEKAALTKKLEAAEKRAEQLASSKPGVSALKPKSRKSCSEYDKDKEMEEDEEEMAEDDELMEEDEEEMAEEEEETTAKWNRLVDRELASCKGDRQKATSKVAKRYPGLRAKLVASANAGRRRSRR
ncbi:signal peptide peptidase SppA [Pirellulaceae bacterium SH449]